jgi:hypothetical protein
MKIALSLPLTASIALGLNVVGCNSQKPQPTVEAAAEEHAHPTAGPHGGDLIELGAEEYHAELLHETEAVVYLLDGAAKSAVAIDSPDVVINVTHDGASEQFKLAASREATDPAGKSSKFSSNDVELVSDLREGHADVQLVVTVNGTPYRGALEHDHDHASHDH